MTTLVDQDKCAVSICREIATDRARPIVIDFPDGKISEYRLAGDVWPLVCEVHKEGAAQAIIVWTIRGKRAIDPE